ncbi:MAG: 30S ribosomal protein S12 methylthiotransferase RimO [Oscillospiraceae bacterium]|nr:30S ribosomal protein S12 methylthiotransferase RimO [Oscillospiraceae bacterium]
MVSLGCSKNQVDAERMLAAIRGAGHELSADAGLCDAVIINTCAFIEEAKRESIDYILEFVKLKEENRIKAVAVTGCLAERYRDEVAKEIPEADVILGIGSNAQIVAAIENALSGQKTAAFGDKLDLPLEGKRVISNLPFYAYLKIAEGCDNLCSYCAIPLIRGKFRSRTMENIIAEAEVLAMQGVTELNLVAQDTTRYGEDIYGRLMLPELLRGLCKIEKLRWIRVLYCYPERVTDELLDVIAAEPKIVKYMDIPIQHCEGEILAAMNRRGDKNTLAALFAKIREKIPGVALRTTIIAGFPGETDAHFQSLLDFVKEIKFDRLGCFAYSKEEDTPAAELTNQIGDEIKQRRCGQIMELQSIVMQSIAENMLGKAVEVLCEGFDRYAGLWFGRSYMDAPDIDTKVFFTTGTPVKPGDYVTVLAEDVLDGDIVGVAVTDIDTQKNEARKLFLKNAEDMQQQSVVNGTSEMTMDEIDDIIAEVRKEK